MRKRKKKKEKNAWLRKIWLQRKEAKRKLELQTKWKSYAEYLKSQDWKKKKNKKLKQSDYACESCGRTYGLQVHHKHYKRIYEEEMKDLIVLCSICHRQKHKLLSNEQIEEMVDKLILETL